MKVHKYQVLVFTRIGGTGHMQTRIYFPEQGVLGYREPFPPFFSDDPKIVNDALRVILGHPKGPGDFEEKYLGEINLPDDIAEKLVSCGKTHMQAEADFREAANTVFDFFRKI